MNEEITEIIRKCRDSSFNRYNYCVNLFLDSFVESLSLHVDYDAHRAKEYKSKKDFLYKITPPFQRANNKWSKKMKQKFIENILMGAKTELLFFRMEEQEDAKIIDGLQRTTAILDFIDGKVKPFGYSHSELGEAVKRFNVTLLIKIYTFEKLEEVGKFYVDMNENITHSKKDIQKAKDWFLTEHSITL